MTLGVSGRDRDILTAQTAPDRPARPGGLLVAVPAIALALFLVPISLGLIGTWAPAFGYLPALGGDILTLEPWRELFSAPGLGGAVRLTLSTGFLSTVLALGLSVSLLAAWHGTRAFGVLRRVLTPLLAVPHAALAIGLAFLLTPSGWLIRATSPWATGWDRPPDFAIVQDPYGIALTLGLALKETPFLLLIAVAASSQIGADRTLAIARDRRLRPCHGLDQDRPAAALSADPPADLCGAGLLPVGGRHGADPGAGDAADPGAAGAALVQRPGSADALHGGGGRLPAIRHRRRRHRPVVRHGAPGGPPGPALDRGRPSGRRWRPAEDRQRRHGDAGGFRRPAERAQPGDLVPGPALALSRRPAGHLDPGQLDAAFLDAVEAGHHHADRRRRRHRRGPGPGDRLPGV